MSVEMIKMLTTSGVEVFPVEVGSAAARAIGQHWNAVQHFLHTGHTSELERFSGVRIGFFKFATNPGWIEQWARRGELDFEEIYESGGS